MIEVYIIFMCLYKTFKNRPDAVLKKICVTINYILLCLMLLLCICFILLACESGEAFLSRFPSIVRKEIKLNMISVEESVDLKATSQTSQGLLSSKDNDSLTKELVYHTKLASNFDYEKVKSIVEILESRYVPIQTTSFLAFALDGKWKHLYSNFPLPRKEANL